MKILITTGLKPESIGGPAQYSFELKKAFESQGHEVKISSYSQIENNLPIGIRHLYFLIKIIPRVIWSDKILTLDTYSTGVPTVVLAKLFGRKSVVRIGGDYLWSAYVNRTSNPITLKEFYKKLPKLNRKEKVIYFFTKILINFSNILAFNTDWQKVIWSDFYKMRESKLTVVRNFIPQKGELNIPKNKNFVWAGRVIPEKNIELLKKVASRIKSRYADFELEIVTGKSRSEVLDHLKSCYAAVSAAFTDICPNFIIEAASFNKPFIMTSETGIGEMYPNGGVFLDPRDEKGWEDSIEAMLDYRVYNKFQGELVINNTSHSWSEIVQSYIDLWKK